MNNKIALLEVIRGVAAILVLIGHIMAKFPIQIFHTNLLFLSIGSWGTEAVIIFFILSGVVIGNSYKMKRQTTKQFLKSRLLRIVPLFVIGIFLAILAEILYYHSVNLKQLIGSLFFMATLQGYITIPVTFNAPIWSLSFEMFFYLIFSLSIHKKHNLFMGIWFLISIICIPFLFHPYFTNRIIMHFIIMFSYSSIWLIGYYIFKFNKQLKISFYNALLSVLMLPLVSRLNFFDVYYDVFRYIIFAIVSIPLFCFALNNKKQGIKNNPLLFVQSFIYILFSIHLYYYSKSQFASKIIYCALPLSFLILFPLKIILFNLYSKLKIYFILLGELSYSIYILHFPVIFLVLYFLKGNVLLALLLSPLLIFVFAYVMERNYHKAIVRLIKIRKIKNENTSNL